MHYRRVDQDPHPGGPAMSTVQNADETRFIRSNDPSMVSSYGTNAMSSTKYTPFNFLPNNLAEQFSRHINRYFLLIATLQLWAYVTPVHPVTTWAPLIIIFTVTMIKEGVDDCKRAARDRELNATVFSVLRPVGDRQIAAHQITVGSLVRLSNDQEVPCDLVVIQAGADGKCFINTASLDGESDLKTREAPGSTQRLSDEQLKVLQCSIECSLPNNNLHQFDSVLNVESDKTSLSVRNFLPHGSVVRGTRGSVLAMAVYTGADTKLSMSQQSPPSKETQSDKTVNQIAIAIFCTQLMIVTVFGTMGSVWKHSEGHDTWYLDYESDEPWYVYVAIPVRFLLLNSYMIPISLKVTLDMCKVVHALLIRWDLCMFDEERGFGANAISTALAEDLGQVGHVLSDKTGTLTRNEMHMVAAVLPDGTHVVEPEVAVPGQHDASLLMWRALACCHTLTTGCPSPGGASPDEIALVEWAASAGVSCLVTDGEILKLQVGDEFEEYQVVAVLEFSSERRRMSMLLRCKYTGEYTLFCKGADDVMVTLIQRAEQIPLEDLENLARKGLRTLVVAYKKISEEDANAWIEENQRAQLVTGPQRKTLLEQACCSLEQNLELVGIVGIEDKLQDKVQETIGHLRSAGMRIWMLTGDKLSTAIQIGQNCGLVLQGRTCLNLTLLQGAVTASIQGREQRCWEPSSDAIRTSAVYVRDAQDRIPDLQTFIAVDSATLEAALSDGAEFKQELADLAELVMLDSVKVVLCCRVTPHQKGRVVLMVKKVSKQVTLAIGDGANDVDMIREAHVGVGIVGREGLHAARAADYSLPNFKSLGSLCLVHGHLSCYRSAMTSQYCFYKSIFLCCVQLLFAPGSAFSGASWLNSFALTMYNTILTGLLPLVFVLDRDHSIESLRSSGHLYKRVATGGAMNSASMSAVSMVALAGAVLVALPHLVASDLGLDQESSGMQVFSAVIIAQVVEVWMITNHATMVHLIILGGSLLMFFVTSYAASAVVSMEMFGVMQRLYASPSYWLAVTISVTLVVFFTRGVQYAAALGAQTVAQAQQQKRARAEGSEDKEKNHPHENRLQEHIAKLDTFGISPV